MKRLALMGLWLTGLACAGVDPGAFDLPTPAPDPPARAPPPAPDPPSSSPIVEGIGESPDDLVVVRGGGPVVVQYSDWRCSHCLSAYPKVRDAARATGAELRFRNFPLSAPCNPVMSEVHRDRCELAAASICAHDRGIFEDFFRAVVDQPDDALGSLQSDPSFSACLRDPGTTRRLAAQIQTSDGLELVGTPTFFVKVEGVWRRASGPDQVEAWLRAP